MAAARRLSLSGSVDPARQHGARQAHIRPHLTLRRRPPPPQCRPLYPSSARAGGRSAAPRGRPPRHGGRRAHAHAPQRRTAQAGGGRHSRGGRAHSATQPPGARRPGARARARARPGAGVDFLELSLTPPVRVSLCIAVYHGLGKTTIRKNMYIYAYARAQLLWGVALSSLHARTHPPNIIGRLLTPSTTWYALHGVSRRG